MYEKAIAAWFHFQLCSLNYHLNIQHGQKQGRFDNIAIIARINHMIIEENYVLKHAVVLFLTFCHLSMEIDAKYVL